MNSHNSGLIDLFPRSEEIAGKTFARDEALRALWRTVAAARAAVDEITEQTPEFTEDDRFASGIIAEQLHVSADQLATTIDK